MKSFISVFNSSARNKANMIFSLGALESSLDQSWKYGLPSCISHDFHRPFAWSKGLALHFEPGLVRLVGITIIPETDSESKTIGNIHNAYVSHMLDEEYSPFEDDLKASLRPFMTENAKPSLIKCAAIQDENIARKVFQEEFEQADKDDLIPIRLLNPIAPGVYEKNGLLVFAHRYFRRSLSHINSLNDPFLELLQQIAINESLDVKIKLDSDVIGWSKAFLPSIELEYWWGPHFTDDLSNLQLGVTRHNADKQLQYFHGISGVDFWWHAQNDNYTLECEEIRDLPTLGMGKDAFGCRYVHSMLNDENKTPVHMDGAIRLYGEEAMLSRIETDISKAGRHTNYTKLWRVDGLIEVSVWKQLLNHYFRDNRLVGEYLGGIEENDGVKPQIIASSTGEFIPDRYIPCNMEPGNGIRISISYHESLVDTDGEECYVVSYDSFSNEHETINYIESDTVVLIKLLRKLKINVIMPDDISYMAFEDMVTNFPLFMHTGPKSIENAMKTQHSIKTLCETWIKLGHDRVISYNIGIRYSDRDILYSVAGHIEDISKWIGNKCSTFPINTSEVSEWCDNNYFYLSENYPDQKDNPQLSKHLMQSGMLVFDRIQLDPSHYRTRLNPETKKVELLLAIDPKESKLVDRVKKGELKAVSGVIVKESKCMKCGLSYNECQCIKYFDEDVVEEMIDMGPVGFFWTSRSAWE